METGEERIENLTSTVDMIKLIFRELTSFRQEMKREVERLREMFRQFPNNSNAHGPTPHSGTEENSSSSGEGDNQTVGEVAEESSDTNDVIDITDFFDDLEVPQFDPLACTISSSEAVIPSSNFSPVSTSKMSADAPTTKTESSEFSNQAADIYSSSSDSEKGERFSTFNEKRKKKTKTTVRRGVTEKPVVEPKKEAPSSVKQEDVSSSSDITNFLTPTPIHALKDDLKNLSPKTLNDFLSTAKDSVKETRKKAMPNTELDSSPSALASLIPIGIIVDPDTGVTTYECPFCHRSSKEHRSIQRHIAVHTNERRFKCIFCSKAFKRASHMRCHMRTHTGERPFKCSNCDKTYVSKTALKAHEILHEKDESRQKEVIKDGAPSGGPGTRERPHRCVYCERLFRQKGHLDLHISTTHLKEKEFHCVVCSKMFARKEHLVRHVRSHTGEKPYQCPTCPKAFADYGSLRKHRITVHG